MAVAALGGDMHRIELRNAVFEGRNNVYYLDGAVAGLVDTGITVPAVREELESGIVAAGGSVSDIDEVLLTHWHPDHSALAGDIQADSGATVRVHEADAPMLWPDSTAREEAGRERERLFEAWGVPEEKLSELVSSASLGDDYWNSWPEVEPFADGDEFTVGGLDLEAVHLPGHAAGQCAFVFEREGRREAFVGDVILPKYTPNVGGADTRLDSPLERYVESLVRVIDLDLDRAWPGHRDPIDDPSGRAAEIVEHHRERTRRVVNVLREHAPCDVWTVSAHLFGDLSGVHILHGPGEAFAHLDHLKAHDVVAKDGEEFVLVDDDANLDALFPDVGLEASR